MAINYTPNPGINVTAVTNAVQNERNRQHQNKLADARNKLTQQLADERNKLTQQSIDAVEKQNKIQNTRNALIDTMTTTAFNREEAERKAISDLHKTAIKRLPEQIKYKKDVEQAELDAENAPPSTWDYLLGVPGWLGKQAGWDFWNDDAQDLIKKRGLKEPEYDILPVDEGVMSPGYYQAWQDANDPTAIYTKQEILNQAIQNSGGQ
jgi:hypothetical protein